MLDYLIVGQGIAGAMLSWFLLKENQKVLVIDEYNPSSASNIASGITKPITGKRFVKTWLADELIPFAQDTYSDFETRFRDKFYHPALFIKLFDSIKAQNDWSVRCASPEYIAYLQNENIIYLDDKKVKNDFGGFEINGGSKLETDKFLSHYRNYLKENKALLEEKFSFNDLAEEEDSISYKGIKARKIIFCEGANAIHNPYFKFFPFQLAKGECLILRIENFYTDRVLNSEVLIMPLPEKDLYYVGATHEWYFDDDQPSAKGMNELLGNLSAVLRLPFEIVEHKAAIRPTVKDRRPFIGFHPEFPNIGIFNGMGTKGISLSPYFAKHFTEHLLHQKPLQPEVDIKRFLL
jgi:glycine oxidase